MNAHDPADFEVGGVEDLLFVEHRLMFHEQLKALQMLGVSVEPVILKPITGFFSALDSSRADYLDGRNDTQDPDCCTRKSEREPPRTD